VIDRASVPSAFATQIPPSCAYAIRVPSGDQAGTSPSAIVTGSEPSAFATTISEPPPVSWSYTILVASGDQSEP
jgi:hypothetical protein